MPRLTCNYCEGEGGWTDVIDYWIGGPYTPCGVCDERGTVSLRKWISIWFWDNAPVRLVELIYDSYDWRHKDERDSGA